MRRQYIFEGFNNTPIIYEYPNMAIIIENQSTCPICDTVLDKTRDYFLVPHIISNMKDSLFIFSDSGVHFDCINNHNLKDKLLHQIDLYDQHSLPSKLKDVVDGKEISGGDLLFLGLLTSDETETLYQFNYLSLNLKNIRKWNEYDQFVFVVRKFLSEGKWASNEFNKLHYILDKISENL